MSLLTLSATALASCDRGADAPKVYSTVQACRTDHPGSACDAAWQASVGEHDKKAPHFTDKAACEAQFGVGHCETNASGSFLPVMAGFMLGQMISNNAYRGYGGYVGHPVFFNAAGGYRSFGVPAGESIFTKSGGVMRGGVGGVSRGGFGAAAARFGGFGHFGGG
jgi:uncharacterized protein YgiB involved in biofilm formation